MADVILIEGFEEASIDVGDIVTFNQVNSSSPAPAGYWSQYWGSGGGNISYDHPVTELYGHVRFYFAGLNQTIYQIRHRDTNVSVSVSIDGSGHIIVQDVNTIIGTGTTVLPVGAWHLVEIHLRVGNATGSAGTWGIVEIRVEGFTTNELTLTNVDTQQGTDTQVWYMNFGGNGTYDDIIFYDAAGTVWNTWVGDKGVSGVYPNAAGDANDFRPDGFTSVARWYFPGTSTQLGGVPLGYPSYLMTLAPDAQWDSPLNLNSGLVRGELADQKRNVAWQDSSQTQQWNGGNVTVAAGGDQCIAQYVSPPLAAQTISGTAKCYMQCQERQVADDARSQIVLRVVSNDGSVVRGVLYAGDTGALSHEWATTYTNRQFPPSGPMTLSSVVASAGDRLVVELGFRSHAGVTNNDAMRLVFGDLLSSADLPEDETTTAQTFDPWIEFSNPLTLAQSGNWGFVDEPTNLLVRQAATQRFTDDDATFVKTSTDNDRDLYNTSDVSAAVVPNGPIKIISRAKKSDPGTRKLAHVYKTSGAEQSSGDLPLSTGYVYRKSYHDKDATDAGVWTAGKITSLQIGPKARA